MKGLIVGVLALALVSAAGASGPIRGKVVRGVFVRSAFDGTIDTAHLKRYIRTEPLRTRRVKDPTVRSTATARAEV